MTKLLPLNNWQSRRIIRPFPLYIDTIGTFEDLLSSADGARERSAYYRVICLQQGEGAFWIDMQDFQLGSACIFFLRPGQFYAAEPDSLLSGHIISFGESFLGGDDERTDRAYPLDLLQYLFHNQFALLQGEIINDLNEIIGTMIKELNNDYPFKEEILKRYFRIFLVHLTRQLEAGVGQKEQMWSMELVKSFMALIERDFLIKKMVSDYAFSLSVTPNYLNQIVKKATGQSAGYHIRQRIALEAKRKAVYSNKCMKEIAYHLGFSDPCHFSKFFKKTTGINFTDFRKTKSAVPGLPEV